jgi:hypothetical protein
MRTHQSLVMRGKCKSLLAAERSESTASRLEGQECSVRSQSQSSSRSARSATRLWPTTPTEPSVRPTEFPACSGRPSFGRRLTVYFARTKSKPPIPTRLRSARADWARMSHTSVIYDASARPPKPVSYPSITEPETQVRPNPSIERTSTGLAHSTPQVYSPFRGPSRWRPAHVKR